MCSAVGTTHPSNILTTWRCGAPGLQSYAVRAAENAVSAALCSAAGAGAVPDIGSHCAHDHASRHDSLLTLRVLHQRRQAALHQCRPVLQHSMSQPPRRQLRTAEQHDWLSPNPHKVRCADSLRQHDTVSLPGPQQQQLTPWSMPTKAAQQPHQESSGDSIKSRTEKVKVAHLGQHVGEQLHKALAVQQLLFWDGGRLRLCHLAIAWGTNSS